MKKKNSLKELDQTLAKIEKKIGFWTEDYLLAKQRKLERMLKGLRLLRKATRQLSLKERNQIAFVVGEIPF